MPRGLLFALGVAIATLVLASGSSAQDDLYDEVSHHFVDNDGVRIHYVSAGSGPLVVFIHGFPDFWYTWRDQMAGLRDRFRVVAIDQRGYNQSGQPEGVEAYDMRFQTADVAAVIRDAGEESATIVGHDLGGFVAWQFALAFPEKTDRLVILNAPHPAGLAREAGSADDPQIFFGNPMTPETLSSWVTDEEARARYLQAFERSDFTAMLNFYKANYPETPPPGVSPPLPEFPRIGMPVLVFHGLPDPYLLVDGLARMWEWVDADLTLVTVPGAGHFVQQGAPQLVTETLREWLLARQ
jgi:pimeloyl-ACP methyl ester carboxylesterase